MFRPVSKKCEMFQSHQRRCIKTLFKCAQTQGVHPTMKTLMFPTLIRVTSIAKYTPHHPPPADLWTSAYVSESVDISNCEQNYRRCPPVHEKHAFFLPQKTTIMVTSITISGEVQVIFKYKRSSSEIRIYYN